MYGKYQGKKALVHWYSSDCWWHKVGGTQINFQVAMEVTSSERYDLVVNTLELPRCNCFQCGRSLNDSVLNVNEKHAVSWWRRSWSKSWKLTLTIALFPMQYLEFWTLNKPLNFKCDFTVCYSKIWNTFQHVIPSTTGFVTSLCHLPSTVLRHSLKPFASSALLHSPGTHLIWLLCSGIYFLLAQISLPI